MKKSLVLLRRMPLNCRALFSCLLTVFLLGVAQNQASAQVSTSTVSNNPPSDVKMLYENPTGLFVTVPVAQQRLIDAMKSLKLIIDQNPEGTGAHTSALRTYTYYNGILAELNAGKGVPESIVAGLGVIRNDLVNGVTATEAAAEKNKAITLLRP